MSSPVVVASSGTYPLGYTNGQIWQCLNGTVVDASEWINCSWAKTMSVELTGFAAGDAVQIRVSNAPTKPLSTDAGKQVDLDFIADAYIKVDLNPVWIRVTKSAAGGTPASTLAHLFLRSVR